MKVKFNGGIKDVPLNEVTAENYIVPANEQHFYHVLQEKVEYDRNNGKRLSRPVLQKYDTKSFPLTEKYLREAGFTITILHNPTSWMAAQKEAAKKAEAVRKEAQKQAAEAKAAAEREALKAELRQEIMDEMKEADLLKKTTKK